MRRTRATGLLMPREFFLTSGKGVSTVSTMNAFDRALVEAGIAQCNLLPVSSIIPAGCRMRRWRKLRPGAIIPVIMAMATGSPGETIGAGLAWAWEREGNFGLVAEAHGHYDRRFLTACLEARLREMAEARGVELGDINTRFEVMKVPQGKFGCVLVALVFLL
ncbi:pyruvoyl-dependent arginine decarboxylase [Candidatus Bathyarchaeota archaeon]|nr:MAG: pyruvoyl-dependent arginine decarboxylase [Candidatus Bathyarchaeota archaeon]